MASASMSLFAPPDAAEAFDQFSHGLTGKVLLRY